MLRHSWWLVFIVGLLAPKATFAARITDYVPLTDPSDNALTYFYDPDKAVGWRDRTVNINVLRSILVTGTYVPTSRTVNSYSLLNDITLSASDVGAVPTSRTVNGYSLSNNISLSATDLGLGNLTNEAQMPLSYLDIDTNMTADSDTRVPSQAAVIDYIANHTTPVTWGNITGTLSFQTDLQSVLNAKVPTSRTINSKALSADITLTPSDVSLGNVTNTAQMPLSYLDTDVNMAADSNVKVPSQAAVIDYVAAHAGGGGGVWGTIIGTLAQQTDLQTALDAKQPLTNFPSLSVNSELALFSGATGKVLTRASGTGFGYLTNGVLSTTLSGASLTALNASNLSSGTVASTQGGAGAINGLMYANGSGVVSAATTAQVNTAIGYTPLNASAFSGTTKITVGATAPVTPVSNEIWVDITGL